MDTNIRQGATASFAIGDVVCPDALKMLEQVGPDLTVTGKITMLSDRGAEKSAFAVVEVHGIHAPLIVPVGRLRANGTSTDQLWAEVPICSTNSQRNVEFSRMQKWPAEP